MHHHLYNAVMPNIPIRANGFVVGKPLQLSPLPIKPRSKRLPKCHMATKRIIFCLSDISFAFEKWSKGHPSITVITLKNKDLWKEM